MNLVHFLFRYSRKTMIWTALAALISGGCNAGLIALVNILLGGTGRPVVTLLGWFVALGAVRLLTNYLAQVSLARFSQRGTASLRRDLVRKILAVPLRQLEEIGAPRLMVALTEDVMSITEAMRAIPTFIVNFAILLGGAVYLGWLSPRILLAIFVLIALGALVYRLLVHSGFAFLKLAREAEDKLFRHFRALTEGIKELKLHRERRDVFLTGGVDTATAAYERYNIAAETRFIIAQNWSQLLFFTLIGLILFLVPKMERVDAHVMTSYVVATLYLMGPLSGLLLVFSVFGRANVSLQKIEQLGLALTGQASDHIPDVRHDHPSAFRWLELTGISHAYHREREDNTFTLGPVNLIFRPGEIVFLVGGNGSGKSTLAKIITGLYPPAVGEIRVDGKLIDDHNRDNYRQLFSTVFADFYLFDTFLGLERTNLDAQAGAYLTHLHLDHKVKIRNGALSTTDLSQGQRKRLALLTAYLEDRPFYLFDEWASDQDPLFKDVFYTQLLPELRAKHKAVLVISHDDRYFHLADRIIKLDYGQIVAEASEAMVVEEPDYIAPAPAR
ncbi:MAG TPA: cyclic peptide export ABC transporter [Opitutaceae bacterium]|jgi:putative ATP-binding cassette transporter|nr:cyclic peptide export ABC transporter [Opitutaceae bacterium]